MKHLSVLLCFLIKTSMLAEFAVYLYENDLSEKDLRVLFQLKNVVYCERQEGIFQLLFPILSFNICWLYSFF